MAVSRDKLYEEVWAEPMTTVAKRYEVSSNFLARVCERLNIPRPPRGYWAQLKVGRKMTRPKLPKPRVGDDMEWSRNGTPAVYVPAPGAQSTPRTSRESRKRSSRHPLIVGASEDFESGRVPRDGYLRPYKRNILDLYVTKDTLRRALDLANDLFLTLEQGGHHVLFQPPDAKHDRAPLLLREDGTNPEYWVRGAGPARDTVVLINGVAIGLTLFEISAEFEARWDDVLKTYVKHGPPRHRKPGESVDWSFHNSFFPSGRLGVRAYAARAHIKWDKYWREKKSGELTAMLDLLGKDLERSVPELEKLIAQHDREAEEYRRRSEEQRQRWEQQELERRRVEREVEQEKEITATISEWRMARDVRAYVAEVRALIAGSGLEITKGGGADEDLKWVLAYADRIDPLSSWRETIEKVKAEHSLRPCVKCGKVHRPNENEAAESVPAGPATVEPANASADLPRTEAAPDIFNE
jgi:hypothetical protein